jgi:hypothetical protein
MRLLQRAGIVIVRPVYRAFVEKPLWWFLAKVKSFFFAETTERLLLIEKQLEALEKAESVEALFRRTQASNAAQWDAIEQLLLAMFRQPEPRDFERGGSDSQPAVMSSATGSSRVNGPNSIR